MNRAFFWLRVAMVAAKERVFGVRCVGCGEHSRHPLPRGWKFTTCRHDGGAAWMCGECRFEGT